MVNDDKSPRSEKGWLSDAEAKDPGQLSHNP